MPRPRTTQNKRISKDYLPHHENPLELPVVFNLLCFLLFALDKRKAQRNQRRIAEATLHLATLPGEATGAWAAILLLHHKNRKAASWGVTLMLTLLQGAVFYFTWPHFSAPF